MSMVYKCNRCGTVYEDENHGLMPHHHPLQGIKDRPRNDRGRPSHLCLKCLNEYGQWWKVAKTTVIGRG